MSYWNKQTSVSSQLDSVSLSHGLKKIRSSVDEFYEIEPAIVLDIILDINHPYIQNKKYKLVPSQWPVDGNNKQPLDTDLDYTWVGRVLVRRLYSQKNVEK